MSAAALASLLGLTVAFSPWSTGTPAARARPPAPMLGAATMVGPEEATAPIEGEGDSEPSDDNGWGDEDTVEALPEEAAPPPGESTPTPPAGAIAIPPTPDATGGIVKKPAPAPGPRKGIGLLAATGAVGAVAWGAAAARLALINRCVTTDQDIENAFDCVRNVSSFLGLTVLVWLANDTTYGLAPASGVVRGRYEASEYAYSGKYDRKGTVWTGVGGAMLGVGIVAKVTMWALTFNVFKCNFDSDAALMDPGAEADRFSSCLRRRLIGQYLGHQLASSTIAAGAGVLGFGVYYTKERGAREKLFFRPQQVRILPYGDRGSMGLGLAGRF